jgi:hypothetical protein
MFKHGVKYPTNFSVAVIEADYQYFEQIKCILSDQANVFLQDFKLINFGRK